MVIPGTASVFSLNSGTQKSWITSSVLTRKSTWRPLGSTSWLTLHPAVVGVGEAPGELLAGHVHHQRVGLLGLDVVQDHPAVDGQRRDDDEGDRDPDDLEAGVAVDGLAVAQVAGLGLERDDRVDDHRHHQHEDRHRDDQQDVVERVDVRRGRGGLRPGTSRSAGRSRCRRWWPARSGPRSRAGAAASPSPSNTTLAETRFATLQIEAGAWHPPDARILVRRPSWRPRLRGRWRAGCRGGGGRPWRTAPAGGSRRRWPPRSPARRWPAAGAAACSIRTRWR